MIPRGPRVLCVALAMVAAVAAGCGGDDGGDPDDGGNSPGSGVDTEITVEILGGEVTGGFRREEVSVGESVRLVVTGDATEPVHLHGYDLFVTPVDGVGEVVFDALIPGRFEVELESSERLLIELTVS